MLVFLRSSSGKLKELEDSEEYAHEHKSNGFKSSAANELKSNGFKSSATKRRCSFLEAKFMIYKFFAIIIVITVLNELLFLTFKIAPEIPQYIGSTCKEPHRVYGGKLMGFFVKLIQPSRTLNYRLKHKPRPLILFGTHHKTGTFFAKKAFSHICAQLNLCCIFERTGTTEEETLDDFTKGNTDVFGHFSWQWFPEELADDYRFIHFYRKIPRKIISGYRYHSDGAEKWTTQKFPWYRTCTSDPVRKCDSLILARGPCRSVLGHSQSDLIRHPDISPPKNKLLKGDELICNYLARIGNSKNEPDQNKSLADAMMSRPLEQGLLIEAALEFYEDYSMANIFNHTWNDPMSLNIDLDMVSRDYIAQAKQMLEFIGVHGDNVEVLDSLVEGLKFYDVHSPSMYTWVMDTPLYKHVTTTSNMRFNRKDAEHFLQTDTTFLEAYQPILELMSGV